MLKVVTKRKKTLRLWCLHGFTARTADGRQYRDAYAAWYCTKPGDEGVTYQEVRGYMSNGVANHMGDKPCEHVELYGEIYTNNYRVSKETWVTVWPSLPSTGKVTRVKCDSYGKSWAREYLILPLSGDGIISVKEDKTPFYKYDPPVWHEDASRRGGGYFETRRYQARSDGTFGGYATLQCDYDDLYYVDEDETGSEILLPWQGTLSKGFYDNVLSCIDYWNNTSTPHWGDLCQEAVNGTRAITLNTLMYCKELLEIGTMLKSTVSSLKNWKSSVLKESANLYLSYHYGYRLSIKDTADLYQAAKHEFSAVKRSIAATRARKTWEYQYPPGYAFNGCTCERTRCVKVWYKQLDTVIGDLLNGLFRWDVFPELGNVYDMIPYSFVVDWFLPFGDILDTIDYHTYASTLNVVDTVRSDAYTIRDLPLDSPVLLGAIRGCTATSGITLKVYRRWVVNELTYPPLELQLQAGPKNWLPAGALILQRTK